MAQIVSLCPLLEWPSAFADLAANTRPDAKLQCIQKTPVLSSTPPGASWPARGAGGGSSTQEAAAQSNTPLQPRPSLSMTQQLVVVVMQPQEHVAHVLQ